MWRSLAVLLACVAIGSASARAHPKPPASGLTMEQLKNTTYKAAFFEEDHELRDGHWERQVQFSALKVVETLDLMTAAFGDLNGDGIPDAAVVLGASGGGSGGFMELAPVLNRGGRPVSLDTVGLGDRSRIQSLTISNGKIAVSMLISAESDPSCCPTHKVQRTYVLKGDKLVEAPAAR